MLPRRCAAGLGDFVQSMRAGGRRRAGQAGPRGMPPPRCPSWATPCNTVPAGSADRGAGAHKLAAGEGVVLAGGHFALHLPQQVEHLLKGGALAVEGAEAGVHGEGVDEGRRARQVWVLRVHVIVLQAGVVRRHRPRVPAPRVPGCVPACCGLHYPCTPLPGAAAVQEQYREDVLKCIKRQGGSLGGQAGRTGARRRAHRS